MSWFKKHPILSAVIIFIVLTLPSAIDVYWDLYQKFKGVPMPSLNLGVAIWVLPLVGLIFVAITIWQVRTSNKTAQDSKNALLISKTDSTILPLPHQYISDSYIKGKLIYLMDLLSPGARPIISNRTIEDCEIRGPAMVILLDGVTIAESGFEGDVDSLFVEVPEKRIIFGAIGLRNCVFRRCRFIAIGIIGTREQIEQAKKGFNQPTSPKEGPQS
jgi:hypothetical protein